MRALAVTAVILYHLEWGCPGGYLGVDVFFVLSGYLITSLILRQVTEGTFSPRSCGSLPRAQMWAAYRDNPRYFQSVEKLLQELSSRGIRTWIVQDNSWPLDDVPKMLIRAHFRGRPLESLIIPRVYVTSQKRQAEPIYPSKLPGITVVDSLTCLSEGEVYPYYRDGHAWYRDVSHLSDAGAERLRPLFEAILREIPAAPRARSAVSSSVSPPNE